jgi:hypothetical protein
LIAAPRPRIDAPCGVFLAVDREFDGTIRPALAGLVVKLGFEIFLGFEKSAVALQT